jgi:hypothetical protein
LVSEVALEQAEAGCLADSELRVLRRERNVENMIAISSLK